MDDLIVPSSIQRIRAFLVERCGMKVKPWASSAETLAALHATLVARSGCDIFWASLRTLLEALACDLKRREEATPGAVLDNEVLDNERYATLLDEIRACLAAHAPEAASSSFHRLARALSAPALGLLLLLGGVASVGCEHSALRNSTEVRDGAPPDVADAKTLRSESNADSVFIVLPDTSPGPDKPSSVDYDISPGPDKPSSVDSRPSGLDGATVAIQDIMDSCNVSATDQASVLACLARLRESWTTGIASVLATESCNAVVVDLACFAYDTTYCVGGGWGIDPTNTDFDPATMPICRPMPVYIGVRFV
jgi:hypothetical protein